MKKILKVFIICLISQLATFSLFAGSDGDLEINNTVITLKIKFMIYYDPNLKIKSINFRIKIIEFVNLWISHYYKR